MIYLLLWFFGIHIVVYNYILTWSVEIFFDHGIFSFIILVCGIIQLGLDFWIFIIKCQVDKADLGLLHLSFNI